eukprot:UN01314
MACWTGCCIWIGKLKVYILTILILILTFTIALTTTILSAQQAGNHADFPCGTPLKECDWKRDICDNDIMTFVSPFRFDVKSALLPGINQCGWSRMNSLFRISVCSIILLSCFCSFVFVTCLKVYNGAHKCEWKTLTIVYLLLLCLIFTALVLDCQSLRNGYQSCENHFEIFNQPIFSQYTIDNCYLSPYIYVIICDIGTVLFCAFTFLLHRLVPFNARYDTQKD